MTAPCPFGFISLRQAKRHAWAIEPDRSKRAVPVRCAKCGLLHLVAPDQEGLTA